MFVPTSERPLTTRADGSSVQGNSPDEAARRKVLSDLEDFGPFWS